MNYVKEVRTRVVWLTLGLLLSLGIAEVIKGFEDTLAANLILASFIPLVVYMSDAVGTQMEAIIIRELNQKTKFRFKVFFQQQVLIIVAVGAIVGALAGLIVALLNNSAQLGIVIGLSLLSGILSSLLTGSIMPYIFWRLHSDPAEASGPIATAMQDLLSVVIFFLIAQNIL